MEQRLKQDVLSEAAQFDNHILVTEEDDDMQVRIWFERFKMTDMVPSDLNCNVHFLVWIEVLRLAVVLDWLPVSRGCAFQSALRPPFDPLSLLNLHLPPNHLSKTPASSTPFDFNPGTPPALAPWTLPPSIPLHPHIIDTSN